MASAPGSEATAAQIEAIGAEYVHIPLIRAVTVDPPNSLWEAVQSRLNIQNVHYTRIQGRQETSDWTFANISVIEARAESASDRSYCEGTSSYPLCGH